MSLIRRPEMSLQADLSELLFMCDPVARIRDPKPVLAVSVTLTREMYALPPFPA